MMGRIGTEIDISLSATRCESGEMVSRELRGSIIKIERSKTAHDSLHRWKNLGRQFAQLAHTNAHILGHSSDQRQCQKIPGRKAGLVANATAQRRQRALSMPEGVWGKT
jgi:hypothetical protein